MRGFGLSKSLLVVFFNLLFFSGYAQNKGESNENIAVLIQSLKLDTKGPFQDIRWYCIDGTTVGPQERCAQLGGVQHARLKPTVKVLEKLNGLYFGQILTGVDNIEFWDTDRANSRLKQYQLERYLRSVDNGWIWRRGQYYRGALQAEDEEAWGIQFYEWLLTQNEPIDQHYYLLRQSLKDIPHKGDNSQAQLIRSQSKLLSEDFPAFMYVRVKIHSQPDESDVQRVRDFTEKNLTRLSESLLKRFDELISNVEVFYKPIDVHELDQFVVQLPETSNLKGALNQYIQKYAKSEPSQQQLTITAAMMWRCRTELQTIQDPKGRLALLELSLKLEQIIFRNATKVESTTLKQLTRKIHALSLASAATGALEIWEWEELSNRLKPSLAEEISTAEINEFLFASRNAVEWGVGMAKATYKSTVDIYTGFEPLANGFVDDRIRSSIGLILGQSVGQLNDVLSRESGLTNTVFNLENQGQIRGLNPGYARGELVVVETGEDDFEVSSDKIYVFQRPPSDLKPIAGIATVSEGNLVSHVQLLARNLGIPNSVVSDQNMKDLKELEGKRVFYAVSLRGSVVMKLETDMTAEERQLFVNKQRNENKITVEADFIKLDQLDILDLSNVKSNDSGKSCGPKAANLGQLKAGFPDNVVDGLVIPFGVFKAHMDQEMPGKNQSYWEFLTEIFSKGNQMRGYGISEAEADAFELRELNVLREAIKQMPLLPTFLIEIQHSFENVFGKQMGEIPVFLRSDTNMEDLKDFKGAGLNLTLFNVLDAQKILQGIRDVWASPYSERSYKCRQKYLLNPTYVFPSILIIPSVDVDYSGVLITKGITNGIAEDLTVAFSRGAGGAVDGQSAETRIIHADGTQSLISPSRDPQFNRLPATGGTEKQLTTFDKPILNQLNMLEINQLAQSLRSQLPNTPGISSAGPYDVELGFKDDQLWFFQVGPFVENKMAQSSTYLESITPELDPTKMISLNLKP
jgi:hypothetical protein